MKFILIASLFSTFFLTTYGQNRACQIFGTVLTASDNDTITISVAKYPGLKIDLPELQSVYRTAIKKQHFFLTIKIPSFNIFPIQINQTFDPDAQLGIQLSGLIERNDKQHIYWPNLTEHSFDGRGSRKMKLLQRISDFEYLRARRRIYVENYYSYKYPANESGRVFGIVIQSAYKDRERSIKMLNSNLKGISRGAYISLVQKVDDLFLGDVLSYFGDVVDTANYLYLQEQLRKNNDVIAGNIKAHSLSVDLIRSEPIAEKLYIIHRISTSPDFKSYMATYDDMARLKLKPIYEYYKVTYRGRFREGLTTSIILSLSRSNDLSYCFSDAMKWIEEPDFKKALIEHCESLPGMPAYKFSLPDSNNVQFQLSTLKGKVIVLDFWFTGCGNCMELTPKLKQVEEYFKNDKNVVFVSISSDKDRNEWLRSLKTGKYTTSSSEINLYTGGRGLTDSLYSKINFQGAPTLKLIDKDGKWCENPTDCRIDGGKDLIAKIEQQLTR